MMKSNAKKLADIIRQSERMVIFTGAGVSTESGISDFRSKGGVFEQIRNRYGLSPEEMLSIDFFHADTKLFYKIYRATFLGSNPKPNAAHRAFADLERRGIARAVVTQNIDDLHQRAGSKKVLELHGNMFRNICSSCGKGFGLEYVADPSMPVPKCDDCGGVVRPDVVLYGESLDPDVMSESARVISEADTLIVAGTSLRVYPAAGFINYFEGRSLVLINRDATPFDSSASFVVRDNVGGIMEEAMKLL
ncbi:MAG: NAD-dependent protein deacylase [bacterium]|nr:NAD-dependent protein deacylase [bacterium]